MKARARSVRANAVRRRLTHSVGSAVSRFQEASNEFDDVAAEILGVERTDLSCMTMLLFGGPASADELASALHASRSAVSMTLERLQLAGYARPQPGVRSRIELTEHAAKWIERIWAPLGNEGQRVMSRYSTRDLSIIAAFVNKACEIQETQTKVLRSWLGVASSAARRSHLRGGLSPAALRRVQLFVEANLARPIHLHDLASRAALSPFHFARAFRTSAGLTPRAFVESRRVALAKLLLTESAQPLAEIAVETGFGTQSRLTTTFRRATGFTPAAYRRGRAG